MCYSRTGLIATLMAINTLNNLTTFAHDHQNYHNEINKHQRLRGLRDHPVDAANKHFSSFETWTHSKEFRTNNGRCSQRDPTKNEVKMTKEVMRRWIGLHRCVDGDERNPVCAKKGENIIEVQTYFHVIKKDTGSGEMTEDQILDSIDRLNEAYAPFIKFSFNINTDVTYTDNSLYYYQRFGSKEEIDMKSQLRKGDCKDLNIYSLNPDGGILGWANFPWDCDKDQTKDGVVIFNRTAPGGTAFPFNLGNTLVHEVGHWLGLFHTFHDGCRKGDEVMDTPPESSPAFGCPKGRDTCFGGGNDPIHNYMDYTDDSCMDHFTQGQFTRMVSMWDEFRNPIPTVPSQSPSKAVGTSTVGVTTPPTNIVTESESNEVTENLNHSTDFPSMEALDSLFPSETSGVTDTPTEFGTSDVSDFFVDTDDSASLDLPESLFPSEIPVLTDAPTNSLTDTQSEFATSDLSDFFEGIDDSSSLDLDSFFPSETPGVTDTPTLQVTGALTDTPTNSITDTQSEFVTSEQTDFPTDTDESPSLVLDSLFPSETPGVTDAPTNSITDIQSEFATYNLDFFVDTDDSASLDLPESLFPSEIPVLTDVPTNSLTDARSEFATSDLSDFSTDTDDSPSLDLDSLFPSETPGVTDTPTVQVTGALTDGMTNSITDTRSEFVTSEHTDFFTESTSENVTRQDEIFVLDTTTNQIDDNAPVPTSTPSNIPSFQYTMDLSSKPSAVHSLEPSVSTIPTEMKTGIPTGTPSTSPTSFPSLLKSTMPSLTRIPSITQSHMPSKSMLPTSPPSMTSDIISDSMITPMPLLTTHTPGEEQSSNHPNESSSNLWMHLLINDFEAPNNWGDFSPGGGDARRYKGDDFSHSGNSSLYIRDGSGEKSSIVSRSINVRHFDILRVKFWFYPWEMERDDEFILEHSIDEGTSWKTVNSWTYRRDFEEEKWYNENVEFFTDGVNSIRLRFRSNASSSRDKVYIDDVELLGEKNAEFEKFSTRSDTTSETTIEKEESVELFFNDFEDSNKWGNFTSGGDDARRHVGGYAHNGQACLYIRGHEGDDSSIVSHVRNISSYGILHIDFWYYPWEMESTDGFVLEYSLNNGSSWMIIDSWFNPTNFDDDKWHHEMRDIFLADGIDDLLIRFRCNSSSRRDKLYIDDVRLSGAIKLQYVS